MLGKNDLLNILNDQSQNSVEKTRNLNKLGGKEFELFIENWEMHDFRPRDAWFYISSFLVTENEKLKLVFPPTESNQDINAIINDLTNHQGIPLRIKGVSESGGHSISSCFTIVSTDIEVLGDK